MVHGPLRAREGSLVQYKKWEILLGAIRRPDLVLRYLRGKQPSEFDLDEVAKFVQSSTPIIVEAGAFDGRDTVSFSRRWPEGHVYAFEPLPTLASKVRAATAGCGNVTVIESAFASTEQSTITLYSFDPELSEHGSSSMLPPGDHLEVAPEIKFDNEVNVPAITVDNWYQSVDRPIIDLLWLDLQGAELLVLQRGESLIAATKCCHIEVSKKPLYQGGATFDEVRQFFTSRGFSLVKTRIPVRSGNAIFVRR